MSVAPPPFSIVQWLGATFLQLVEAPGAWLTNFVDGAEDIWATDPLLSDDDEFAVRAQHVLSTLPSQRRPCGPRSVLRFLSSPPLSRSSMSESTSSPTEGMFNKLKGKAKQMVGSVTGNDVLKTEGKLQEQTSEAAEQARKAEVRADHEEAEAEVDAALAENAIESQRLQTEQAAAARRAQVESEAERTEQQLEQQIAQREQAVEQQANREQVAASRDQVAAAQDRAKAEADAARIENLAEQAKADAAELEDPDQGR